MLEQNPDEFCNLDEYIEKYGKSAGEYFYWIVRRGWICRISIETKRALEQIGYLIYHTQDNLQTNFIQNLTPSRR